MPRIGETVRPSSRVLIAFDDPTVPLLIARQSLGPKPLTARTGNVNMSLTGAGHGATLGALSRLGIYQERQKWPSTPARLGIAGSCNLAR